MVGDLMFEVYIGRVGRDVVYVGSGRKGRHKHLNSGKSNVYEANKFHIQGGYIFVQVIPVATKEESLTLELKLIKEKKPLWNIIHNSKEIDNPVSHSPSPEEQDFYSLENDGNLAPLVYSNGHAQLCW